METEMVSDIVWDGPEGLAGLLESALPELTEYMTGIRLERRTDSETETEPWVTVYTLVDGRVPLLLAMHTTYLLLERVACHFTGGNCSESEVAECGLEFFNVFCGWVTAALYGRLGCSATMYPPRVAQGRYFPAELKGRDGTLKFSGDRIGCLELRWVSPADGLPADELELFRSREI